MPAMMDALPAFAVDEATKNHAGDTMVVAA
jgi:hypothetical protein